MKSVACISLQDILSSSISPFFFLNNEEHFVKILLILKPAISSAHVFACIILIVADVSFYLASFLNLCCRFIFKYNIGSLPFLLSTKLIFFFVKLSDSFQ